MPLVIVIFLLVCTLPLLVRRQRKELDQWTDRDDAPARLLGWAVGLLSAEKVEWGRAMLGELDPIEGRSPRWRFALGCMAGVVFLPPWGPVGPMAALGAVALGSAVVLGFGFVHFGLASNPSNWVILAILAVLVMGSVVAGSMLLRRPGVARPGLVGGLFVSAAWLAASRFTFLGILDPIRSIGRWSVPALFIAVPLVVGVGGAWRSGSALVGRHAAWLAGVSAGLAMFFASAIAVVAIDGGPRDPGVSVAGGVSEALSVAAMLFLILLPLTTATIGWTAATATALFRRT